MSETRVEFRTHLTAPFGKPDRSASPQDDREPDREHRASEPEKRIDPPYSAEALRAESIEGARRVNHLDDREVPQMRGCEPWEYREPRPMGLMDTDGNPVLEQPPPPTHVPGFHPESARLQHRVVRELSETQAQRMTLAHQLGIISAQTSKADVRTLTGLTRRQLRRQKEARSK